MVSYAVIGVLVVCCEISVLDPVGEGFKDISRYAGFHPFGNNIGGRYKSDLFSGDGVDIRGNGCSRVGIRAGGAYLLVLGVVIVTRNPRVEGGIDIGENAGLKPRSFFGRQAGTV